MAAWCDLPMDLLGLVIALLPNPANHARSRSACQTWHSAMRLQERPLLPWVVLTEGEILTLDDGRWHRLPSFPDNGACVGSTDDWLVVGLGDNHFIDGRMAYILHSYFLHNPFSGMSVPLTMLNDTIVDNETCVICKFLMRSTVDDIIAVITGNKNYHLIVFREGKGVWFPKPRSIPYINIIDIAFLGDTLYAITRAEDLFPLNLALDGDGKPVVTMGRRVIRPINTDDDDNADDEEEEEQEEEQEDYEEEDDWRASINYDECWFNEETGHLNVISRHLIESRGKLFLVREHKLLVRNCGYTRQVEVLEADASAGAWVPLPIGSGLGGGRALFIGQKFCKFVIAPCGKVEEDIIYNIDTGEVFDMKSQTSRQRRLCKTRQRRTWLFPPELVL